MGASWYPNMNTWHTLSHSSQPSPGWSCCRSLCSPPIPTLRWHFVCLINIICLLDYNYPLTYLVDSEEQEPCLVPSSWEHLTQSLTPSSLRTWRGSATVNHESELKTTMTTVLKEPFLSLCADLDNSKILSHNKMVWQVADRRVWKRTGHKGEEIWLINCVQHRDGQVPQCRRHSEPKDWYSGTELEIMGWGGGSHVQRGN